MEIAYILNAVMMAVAVSLGVGCSTVAITQFFVAISDGDINQDERKMMGVVYILLRVAMVGILLTLIIQAGFFYYLTKSLNFISPVLLSLWTVVGVLFLNAIGMTLHWVPSKIGPALQASSWYTLGVLFALIPLWQWQFIYLKFLLVYVGVVLLTIAAVNIVMTHLMQKRG